MVTVMVRNMVMAMVTNAFSTDIKAEFKDDEEPRKVSVAGRMMSRRVMGYGEDKTPVSLVRSCSVFLYADRKESKAEENTPEFFIRRDMEYFDKAFEQAADGKEEVSLSLIGGALKKMMPKFKVRRYGCKTLGKLYERLDRYELVMTEKGVASAVRMKGRAVRQE